MAMFGNRRQSSLGDLLANAVEAHAQSARQAAQRPAPRAVARTYHPPVSERIGNALASLIGREGGHSLGNLLRDWTPIGNIEGVAADPSLRSPNALLSALPIPGPARRVGRALQDIVYHGSPSAREITNLRPSAGGELGPGVYFSREQRVADGYAAGRVSDDGPSPNRGTLQVDIGGMKIANLRREDWLRERAEIMDELRAANGGQWDGSFYYESMRRLEDRYKRQGFHGIYDDTGQGIIFSDHASRARVVR